MSLLLISKTLQRRSPIVIQEYEPLPNRATAEYEKSYSQVLEITNFAATVTFPHWIRHRDQSSVPSDYSHPECHRKMFERTTSGKYQNSAAFHLSRFGAHSEVDG
jgi:hypothetical protein